MTLSKSLAGTGQNIGRRAGNFDHFGRSKMHLQGEIHDLAMIGAARPGSGVDNPLPCEDRDMQVPTSWHWL